MPAELPLKSAGNCIRGAAEDTAYPPGFASLQACGDASVFGKNSEFILSLVQKRRAWTGPHDSDDTARVEPRLPCSPRPSKTDESLARLRPVASLPRRQRQGERRSRSGRAACIRQEGKPSTRRATHDAPFTAALAPREGGQNASPLVRDRPLQGALRRRRSRTDDQGTADELQPGVGITTQQPGQPNHEGTLGYQRTAKSALGLQCLFDRVRQAWQPLQTVRALNRAGPPNPGAWSPAPGSFGGYHFQDGTWRPASNLRANQIDVKRLHPRRQHRPGVARLGLATSRLAKTQR